MQIKPDPFRTDDLSIAAFLSLSLGVDPVLEWEMSSCYFVFEPGEDLNQLVYEYVSGAAMVEPCAYNLEHGKIKKAMFSSGDAPRTWKRGRS